MPSMPCRDLNELHPCLKRGAEELLRRCKAQGVSVLITNTYRTKEYQNQLYAQGRTVLYDEKGKKLNIVTNCKGGTGPHEFRIAFDFAPLLADNQIDWTGKDPQWTIVGKMWESMGGEWGGSWKGFVDKPHCQYTGPYTDAQIRAGKVMPADQKMPWEKLTAAKEDDEVISKTVIIIDGKTQEVDTIVKNGYNYIKLRDLASPHIAIGYDEKQKMATVDTK